MDNTAKVEAPHSKSWQEVASDVVHNPIADLAIAGAVAGAVVLSRGKLAGAAEKLFPKAAMLLGETAEKEAPSAFNIGKVLPGRDPNLTSRQLAKLADHELSAVQYNVATHPNVSSETLSRLARTGDASIRETVAVNAKTTPETLDQLTKLANIGDPINMRIAANPATGAETLDKLAVANASKLDPKLRIKIAEHPNTTPETLAGLLDGEGQEANIRFWDQDVVKAVASNPRTSSQTLLQIATSRDLVLNGTMKTIIEHPNTDLKTLESIVTRERLVEPGTREAARVAALRAVPETSMH